MSKKTGTIIKFVSLGVAVVLLIVLLWLMLDKGKEPEQIAYSGDEVNSLTSLIENGDARAVCQRLGGIRPRQRLGDELREFQSRPHIERRLCRGIAGVFGVLRLCPLS